MAITNLGTVKDLALINPEDINSLSEHYGKELADPREGIKTNQVRNIYSSVLALRTSIKKDKVFTDEIKQELIMLKPKLAYAAGRQKRNNQYKKFQELLSKAIDLTVSSGNQIKALGNFILIVESIVAYHKFFGGQD